MSISYEGIGCHLVTFPAGDCQEGQVCKIDQSGKADACIAGEKFCGIAHAAESGMAAVQVEGFAKVSYSGTQPAVGYAALSADGAGGVMCDAAGREFLVVRVDSGEMSAIIKL